MVSILRPRLRSLALPCGALLAALLLAATLLAQTAQTTTLRGVVENAETHQPIARVLVSAPNGDAAVLTDNSGRFLFPDVPLGSVTISFQRPGFFAPESGGQIATRVLNLSADSADQTLTLEPAAALHGQMLMPESDSDAGMRIDLYAARAMDGRQYWQLTATTVPDNDGSFAFEDLAPGSYLVHSEASMDPTPAGTAAGVRWGYPPVWAPAGGDIHSASVYTLGGGTTAEARVGMERARFYPVQAEVNGAANDCQVSGNGFAGWPVRAQRRGDSLLTTELPSGSYRLRCGARGVWSSTGESFGEIPLHVADTPLGGATLTMSTQPVLSIHVQVDGNAAGQEDASAQPPRLASLLAIPVDEPEVAPRAEFVQYDEATGAVSVRGGLPPGRYWIVAAATGGYVAALSAGGVNLLDGPLTVAAGAPPSIDAVLRADYGSVTVTVEGALLTGSCTVELIPLSGEGVEQMLPSQSAGVTTFAQVAPGDYLAIATRSRAGMAYREPAVLQQLRGVRVSVASGGTAAATLASLSPPVAAGGAP